MMDTDRQLRDRMKAAADALDFEEARRLRDMLALMAEGASTEEAERAVGSDSFRQRPGHMGLGTGQSQVAPPAGWHRPPKPDPMISRRRGRRKRD